jgi:ATP-binding cassette subfamily F protein uup
MHARFGFEHRFPRSSLPHAEVPCSLGEARFIEGEEVGGSNAFDITAERPEPADEPEHRFLARSVCKTLEAYLLEVTQAQRCARNAAQREQQPNDQGRAQVGVAERQLHSRHVGGNADGMPLDELVCGHELIDQSCLDSVPSGVAADSLTMETSGAMLVRPYAECAQDLKRRHLCSRPNGRILGNARTTQRTGTALTLLNATELRKSFGGRIILAGVSFSVDEGEKVGFIGANGSGKSTLFRIVAGLDGADAGAVALRRGASVRYLAQEPEFAAGQTILDAVADGRPELRAAFTSYEHIGEQLASAHADHDRLVARQAELAATIDRLGGWDWTHRAEAMLTRLDVDRWQRGVDALSGGEAKRVALARALLAEPELLLLDEPTNHLDADTVLLLEEYLIEYAGAVMLITHDRYFLDRVVDRMIEIAAGELTAYEGGYTEYLEAQAARTQWQATVDAKRRRLIEQELEWARRSPPARTGKSRARIQRARGLEVESRTYRDKQTRDMRLTTADTPRLGRTVLDLHGIHKAYGDRVLIRNFSAVLRAGERIGIIGPNGIGKTTLVRIILGEMLPDAGKVEVGVNTRIAYFDQNRTQLDPELSVYEAAGNTDWIEIGERRVHLRSYLEDFLFPTERQQQKVSSLSGGERNRLMLAKLLMQPSNLLILDEPTNDLDLVTLQVLEAALVDYAGCVLMVTHDRFFLDKIATALFVFEGDGVVHRHEGGFELYRRLREQREVESTAAAQAAARTPKVDAGKAKSASPARRRLNWNEQRELEGMEARILEAEHTRDQLAQRLEDPELYRDATAAASASSAYAEAKHAVDALYARWEELESRSRAAP